MRNVCAEPRAPRPRDRDLGTRSWPTATPAFEPPFELCRERTSLSSSSASKSFFQHFYAPTGERLRAGSTSSTRTLTTASLLQLQHGPQRQRLAGPPLWRRGANPIEGCDGHAPRNPGQDADPTWPTAVTYSRIHCQGHPQGRGNDRGAGFGRSQGLHSGAGQRGGLGCTGSVQTPEDCTSVGCSASGEGGRA